MLKNLAIALLGLIILGCGSDTSDTSKSKQQNQELLEAAKKPLDQAQQMKKQLEEAQKKQQQEIEEQTKDK